MSSKVRGNANVVLLASLAILLLIIGAIGGFLVWQHAHQADEPAPPAYVNLGPVVAQAGGGRFIRTEVQLEILGAEYAPLFQSSRVQVMDRVRNGLGQMTEEEVYSVEGKQRAQELIVLHLNHFFERPLVQHVYFSNFMVAGG